MRKNRVTAAIEENTAAREALTGQLRPIDYSGHVPHEPEANPKQTASTLLSGESLAERFDIPDHPHERNIWYSALPRRGQHRRGVPAGPARGGSRARLS